MSAACSPIDLSGMRASADAVCALLKVLSNPDRLLMMCELAQCGELCVSDIEARLDIHQPTLSQQLGVLREHALVDTRRDGKNIYYALTSEPAVAIMAVLYEQFCATHQRESAVAVDLVHFTPGLSFAGGLLIGAAAALLVFFDGRIAGVSGIVGGLLAGGRSDAGWRAAFLVGLIAAAVAANALDWFSMPAVDAGWARVIAGGVLVGIGTRYAGGCTSGHGVCGISRGALRSIVATAVFMAAGIATVFVLRHVVGG